MTDRTVLADALQGATVEMLREDAAYARVLSDNETDIGLTMQRLAALAIAVADLEENGRSVSFFGKPARWDRVEIDGDDVDCAAQGSTLPAALASLLRGAP